jgi:hypothetical protein
MIVRLVCLFLTKGEWPPLRLSDVFIPRAPLLPLGCAPAHPKIALLILFT